MALTYVLLGLGMTIYVNQDEYVGALSPIAGIKLVVHRHDQHPFISEEAMVVGVGQKKEIKVSLVSTGDRKMYH